MAFRLKSHITWIDNQIKEIDCQIVAAMNPYKKECQLMQTIPGIDEISAVMLLAELGTDMECFGNKKSLNSWAGMCPGNNDSAGKKKRSYRQREYICKAVIM